MIDEAKSTVRTQPRVRRIITQIKLVQSAIMLVVARPSSDARHGFLYGVCNNFTLDVENERGDTGRDPQPIPSRETKLSRANEDRGSFFLPVQLTTSRIGDLIRLIYHSPK